MKVCAMTVHFAAEFPLLLAHEMRWSNSEFLGRQRYKSLTRIPFSAFRATCAVRSDVLQRLFITLLWRYSYLSVSSGSTLVARRAGK